MCIRGTCWTLGGDSDGGDTGDGGSGKMDTRYGQKGELFPQVALLRRRCWGDPQCGPRYRSREEARVSRETRFLSHMQVAWHRWELGAERTRCHRQVELRDPE